LEATTPALTTSVKLSFGVGQMAEGLKNSSFSAFLLFYYNQVLGLSGDAAGLAIAISLIFDAVSDPVAGISSDRWQGPRGRRHPFMYASALPLAVSFYFLFAPLDVVAHGGQTGLFVWMLVFTILTRGAMTLYHVPHLALGAELSTDYDERTSLVAIRQFLSACGHLLTYAIGFGIFFAPTETFPNGQLNDAAYPPFAFWLAVLMFVTIFMSAYGTRSRIPYLPKASAPEGLGNFSDLMRETLSVGRNRSLRWLMLSFVLTVVAFGIATATGLYTFTFFWELERFQVLVVLLMGPAGSLVGYVLAGKIFAKLDKRNAMIAGGIGWMVLHTLPVGFYFLGFAPANGTWALTALLAVIYLSLGASIAQVFVGISTTIADIADEHELDTGARQEGVLFGAVSFASKCTGALGSLIAGFILTYIEWPTGEAVKSATDVPAETLLALAIAVAKLIFYFIGVVFFGFHGRQAFR